MLNTTSVRALRDALTGFLADEPAQVPRRRPDGPQRYRGNGNHAWETVVFEGDHGRHNAVDRLRVPGGWIYRTSAGQSFVPLAEVIGYDI